MTPSFVFAAFCKHNAANSWACHYEYGGKHNQTDHNVRYGLVRIPLTEGQSLKRPDQGYNSNEVTNERVNKLAREPGKLKIAFAKKQNVAENSPWNPKPPAVFPEKFLFCIDFHLRRAINGILQLGNK